jgi:hypothetical protein
MQMRAKMIEVGKRACAKARAVIEKNLSHPDAAKNMEKKQAQEYFEKVFQDRGKDTFWQECHTSGMAFKDNVHEILEKWVKKIQSEKMGACSEYSLLVLYFLYEEISKNPELSFIDAEVVEMEDFDHEFVRMFIRTPPDISTQSSEFKKVSQITDEKDIKSNYESNRFFTTTTTADDQKEETKRTYSSDNDDEDEVITDRDWAKSKEKLEISVIVDAWSGENEVYPGPDIEKRLNGLTMNDDKLPELIAFDAKEMVLTDSG